MRNGILLLVLVSILGACRSDSATEITAENVSLPEFQAVDSDGNQVRLDPLITRPVLIAFFDPGSVLAWRTLAQLDRKSRALRNISFIGIASSQIQSAEAATIDGPKMQFDISFPIVSDPDGRALRVFQIRNCCDLLQIYDAQGTLKQSVKLSESINKLDLILVELTSTSSAPNSESTTVPIDGIKVGTTPGRLQPLPIADHGLTLVNLFDEFCSECDTGDRLQTVARLNQSARPPAKILLVFSGSQFSQLDLENFTVLLSNDFLIKGDIEAAKPHLNNGKLLLIIDSSRNVVWQEKRGMKEEEVFAAVWQLLTS